MDDELRQCMKKHNVNDGKWVGSDGKVYKVYHCGNFFIHSITIKRIPNRIDPDILERIVSYDSQKDRYGRNAYHVYIESAEEFEKLFNSFLLGYKEYQALSKKLAIEDEFN